MIFYADCFRSKRKERDGKKDLQNIQFKHFSKLESWRNENFSGKTLEVTPWQWSCNGIELTWLNSEWTLCKVAIVYGMSAKVLMGANSWGKRRVLLHRSPQLTLHRTTFLHYPFIKPSPKPDLWFTRKYPTVVQQFEFSFKSAPNIQMVWKIQKSLLIKPNISSTLNKRQNSKMWVCLVDAVLWGPTSKNQKQKWAKNFDAFRWVLCDCNGINKQKSRSSCNDADSSSRMWTMFGKNTFPKLFCNIFHSISTFVRQHFHWALADVRCAVDWGETVTDETHWSLLASASPSSSFPFGIVAAKERLG